MQNEQLSADAKNVKIITVDGKVTLRGPVKNDQEAKAVADAAQSVAGAGVINNQLEVKTTNP
jgi:osmotically-inducible protein OsmY